MAIELKTLRRPDIGAAPFEHQFLLDPGPGKAILVVRVSFDASCSAVVATRTPFVTFRDLPELTAVSVEPNALLVAGSAVLCQFLFGAPWDLGTLQFIRTNELPRLPRVDPFRLDVAILNGQVGDALNDCVVQYLEGEQQEIFALVK